MSLLEAFLEGIVMVSLQCPHLVEPTNHLGATRSVLALLGSWLHALRWLPGRIVLRLLDGLYVREHVRRVVFGISISATAAA